MTLSIRNLDAPLGAEVSGIDLSKPVALGDVERIEDVWRERLVVVFHGQKLSDPQLIAFSRNSMSSRTSSKTASRSEISATVRRCGMLT
jgi:alpha-ketoglutarate-dependent taurine dioxygenase